MPLRSAAGLGALLALTGLGAAAASSLRRASAGRRALAGGFDDLVQCEVAYDKLAEQCSRGQPGAASEPEYTASEGRRPGLSEDQAGSGTVTGRSVDEQWITPYRPPRSVNGNPGGVAGWDYRLHGENWQTLGQCGGPDQSPVDLPKYVDVRGQTKSLLWFDYYVDPDLNSSKAARLVNDGHGLKYDVRANGVDLGFLKIASEEFVVEDYVFHAPSEHSLDGAVFPLELQIHHKPKGGGRTVGVAIFFREGPSSPFLAGLKASMGGVAPIWSVDSGSRSGTLSGRFPNAFNLEALLPPGDAAQERSFYNYQGSLTQPPCTIGVDWWVLSTPVTATRDEIRLIRRALYLSPSMRHGNARSTMPLGKRKVFVAIAGFQNSMKPRVVPFWSRLDEGKQPRGYSSGDVPWGPHWLTESDASEDAAESEEEDEGVDA